MKEYYIKKKFQSVKSSVALFKDDALCSTPGSQFFYTTHGYTLISAVLEVASGKTFPVLTRQLFRDLGLEQTYLDENEPLIYHRSR